MADEERLEEVQRWTAKRRVALVLSVLKGETSTAEAARKHGLTVAEIERWRDRFLLGAENALRARAKDEEALREVGLRRLQREVLIRPRKSSRFAHTSLGLGTRSAGRSLVQVRDARVLGQRWAGRNWAWGSLREWPANSMGTPGAERLGRLLASPGSIGIIGHVFCTQARPMLRNSCAVSQNFDSHFDSHGDGPSGKSWTPKEIAREKNSKVYNGLETGGRRSIELGILCSILLS